MAYRTRSATLLKRATVSLARSSETLRAYIGNGGCRKRRFDPLAGYYQSKRCFTYLNDESVGARVVVDATLGARVHLGDRKFELQTKATNLLDAHYIAAVGSNEFGNSGDNQTLLAGAPLGAPAAPGAA